MNSYDSLNTRFIELTRQLHDKDSELDDQMDEVIKADFDNTDYEIEAAKKNLHDNLRHRVEAVKKGITDRKNNLRHRIEEAKKRTKDHLTKKQRMR